MTKFAGSVSLAALIAPLLAVAPAAASSHREAPAITERPKVDNTDVYAFRSYEPGRSGFVTIIANFQGLQAPYGGPNYFTMDPDAVYEIHVDNDGDARENLTFQFRFANRLKDGTGITLDIGGVQQPIALRTGGPVTSATSPTLGETERFSLAQITGDRRTGTKATVTSTGGATTFAKPLDNIGTKTIPNYASYVQPFIHNVRFPGCATAGRAFVGQREEAFAVNLGPTFDLINYVPIDAASGFPGGIRQSRDNDDLIGEFNVTSLAVEVPISCLRGRGNGVIGVWSSASLPQTQVNKSNPTYLAPQLNSGPFVQVSRLGMPLVNELVIGLPQKDLFNAAVPTQDGALASYVTNPTFPALVDILFRDAVNGALGADIDNLAPANLPRADLVAAFLTGLDGLNQMVRVTPSEMIRLNTGIDPTPRATQANLGVLGGDLAGFPNGRRPGDDTVDIVLRVAMGRLCHPVTIAGTPTDLGLCEPEDAPIGLAALTDGAPVNARDVQNVFPYLNNPLPGSPRP